MNRNEFRVLNAIRIYGKCTQRDLSKKLDMSLGLVNCAYQTLRKQNLVEANGITKAGLLAMEPYKVQNAVIMAAGMSTRFAPISYERPKGVLKVKGEILIERQIRQLIEAGIEEITVVVGYKKEEFFYLEDKFNVKIVVNPEYFRRNNNSTILAVAPILGNTYICSSDDYFVSNPFEKYVYESYYAAEYVEGTTEEYCITARGKDNHIVRVKPGGADSWVMLGHAYWDKIFAGNFISILHDEYDNPATAGKLWEDIYLEHISELSMVMRTYEKGTIWEFDSLDELSRFDATFIENVDSDAIDNICQTLNCSRLDLNGFKPLNDGLTNYSVFFKVGSNTYVYRHPGPGTDVIINRNSETFSQEVARELGIDRTYIYENKEAGWKISRYIPDCTEFNYHDKKEVSEALSMIRKLHKCGIVSPWSFDLFDEAQNILGLMKHPQFRDFKAIQRRMTVLRESVLKEESTLVLCHNDFYAPNILVHHAGLDLIDWEYSAMSDYASDLGTFICCSDYTIEEALHAIELYFERKPTESELQHCIAYVAIASFYWFVWALYKDTAGDPVGEWLYLWYRKTKTFGQYAEKLYGIA